MKIILDPFKLFNPSVKTIEVGDESSYKIARRLLLEYKLDDSANTSTIIHVFQLPFINWFNDVKEVVEYISPKVMLAEKNPRYNLPTDLSDQDIISLGLLSLPIVPSEEEIFQHFIGLARPEEIFDLSRIYHLAKVSIDKNSVFQHAYISRLWVKELTRAVANSPLVIQKIMRPVIERDLAFSSMLIEGIYCAKNKLFFAQWIHENIRQFILLEISRADLEALFSVAVRLENDKRFERTITNFVRDALSGKIMSYEELSGEYPGEIDAIISLKPLLSQKMLELLLEKFDSILSAALRLQLKQLCVPQFTPSPDVKGLDLIQQTIAWKNWSSEAFIPYKFYFDQLAECPEDALINIEQGSVAFSDWFFGNYKSIIQQTEIFTNLGITDKINRFLNEGNTKVIWLIIDGFPACYSTLLENLLRSHGINQIELNWSFATVPTVTNMAIPSMLSGRFEAAIDNSLKSRREDLLKQTFYTKKCRYSAKVADFRKLLADEFDLCCIHTLEIDDNLHKGEAWFDKPRIQEIERLLNNRIDMVASRIKENPKEKFKLIISTDHGATKCLKNGRGIRNKKLNEALLDKPRERSVELIDGLENEVVDPNEVYVLRKEASKNRADWAIARGYHYFGVNDDGYRHGGMSPEEIVVPVLFCEVSVAKQIELQIRYSGSKDLRFGKTEKDFKIRIRNNGHSNLELIELHILQDPDCLFTLPVMLEAQSELSLETSIKIAQKYKGQARAGKLLLDFQAACLSAGEKVSQKLSCVVSTEKDLFFDDDFNF